MNPQEFLDQLKTQGIRLEPLPNGNLFVAPKERVTPELLERIRQNKPALLAHFQSKQQSALADEALALLQRLKCYTVPSGRIDAAREIAERCASRLVLWENGTRVSEDDPASILAALRTIENELIANGGSPDPELTDAVEIVEQTFPGARLLKIQ
jgi:hypothetical protein